MIRVTCNGCFDGLHSGHLFFLGYVRGLADQIATTVGQKAELVVGINSDDYIRRHKRPNPMEAQQRARALLATGVVNRVEVFDGDDPVEFIRSESPAVHVVGAEYTETAVEADVCREIGTRLAFAPRVGAWSTTAEKGKYERDDEGTETKVKGRVLGDGFPGEGP